MQTNIKVTSPYSHGLEKTYGFETVDIKSVKPLNSFAKNPSPVSQPLQKFDFTDSLLEFPPPLGRGCFSLLLDEPPSVLQLSPLTKKALSCLKIDTLKQLYQQLPTLNTIKGLGLGHIQEISEKTIAYLGAFPFEAKATADTRSLINIILADTNPKERYIVLSKHGLDHYVTVSQQELQELNKIPEERKREIYKNCLTLLKASKKSTVVSLLQNILSAFIIPFIDQRLGVVEKWELDECVSRYLFVNNPSDLAKIIQFIENILDVISIYDVKLYRINLNFYASRHQVQQAAFGIISAAKSYFYSKLASFNLNALATIIRKADALRWEGYPDGFIEKVLILSGHFTFRRDPKGIIELSLALPNISEKNIDIQFSSL